MITSESLQNFSQDYLKRACPPKSHNFIDIFPLFIHNDTFLDFVVIKADSGDSILFKAAVSNRLNEGGFACILKADDGYLELFVEESGLDPGKYFIYEGKHFLLVSLY